MCSRGLWYTPLFLLHRMSPKSAIFILLLFHVVYTPSFGTFASCHSNRTVITCNLLILYYLIFGALLSMWMGFLPNRLVPVRSDVYIIEYHSTWRSFRPVPHPRAPTSSRLSAANSRHPTCSPSSREVSDLDMFQHPPLQPLLSSFFRLLVARDLWLVKLKFSLFIAHGSYRYTPRLRTDEIYVLVILRCAVLNVWPSRRLPLRK